MKIISILLVIFCSIYNIQAQEVYIGKNSDSLRVYECANGARFCIKNGERVYIKDPVKKDAYRLVDGFRSGDIIDGKTKDGLLIYKTPLNGTYYLDVNGYVVSISENENPKLFTIKGKIPNSSFYDNTTVNQIKANFSKMGQIKTFGGFEGTVSHLKSGSIFYCRTSKENWAKLQIISFGDKKNIPSELYIRYTVYHKKTNEIISSSEYTDLFMTHFYDLDKNFFAKWDFHWNVRNGLLFFNGNNKKDVVFYLVKEEDMITNNVPTSIPQNVVSIQPISSQIHWTHHYNNISTTNESMIEVSACVEISEEISEYTLLRNKQRVHIMRRFIPKRDNDCLNQFRDTVKLHLGDNECQLQVHTKHGDIYSDVFRIKYDPNAKVSQKTRRLALVIGNSKYAHIRALPNPIHDATDMTNTLREIGFDVISITNANLLKMNEKLDEFSEKLKNYDIGMVYYAGHGLQLGNANYLVPINANPITEADVPSDCLAVTSILARMKKAGNKANILLLDACRDNPLKKVTQGSGLAEINNLNNHLAGNLFIGFATDPGSFADDGLGRNGIYTAALLQHLRMDLSVTDFFTNVNKTVQNVTHKQQRPWISLSSSLTETIYLKR